MKRPSVFLDRDNTIIHNDGDLGDPDQVKLIQGVAPAIASLCGLGYKLVVVTNQGGVARGKYGEADVDAVHDRLEQLITDRVNGARIDAFYFCPFHPQGKVAKYKKDHPTRKPKPGMLLQAAEDMGLDLEQSWMVGDSLRDIDAGAAAGCRTILLQADWTNTSLADLRKNEAKKLPGGGRGRKKHEPDFVAKGLVEAVRIVASQRKPEASEEISRTRIAGKRWDAEAMAKLQKQGRAPKTETPPAATEDTVAPAPDSVEPVEAAADSALSSNPPEKALPAHHATPDPDAEMNNGQPGRPFVPWTKQAPEPSADAEAPRPDRESDAEPTDAVAPPEERSAVVEVDPPAPASPSVASPAEIGSDADASVPASSADAPPEADEVRALNKTMRLVLQELRMQRGTSGEFHQLGVAAIVIQAVAFVCLLGALWMGGGSGGDGAFLRWIGVAVVLQLSVIATLLFSRPSA
ncbi:MAG: HAD-IIIA family hydrolase [Planctomycetota bacterium]